MKTITFQYVSMKSLMKLVLEKTDFLNIASANKCSDDVMRDFHDGGYAKQNELLSSWNTLSIILYIHDFEVTNPLSPKAETQKLGA